VVFICCEYGFGDGVVCNVRVGGGGCVFEDIFNFVGEIFPVGFVVVGVGLSVLGDVMIGFGSDGDEYR